LSSEQLASEAGLNDYGCTLYTYLTRQHKLSLEAEEEFVALANEQATSEANDKTRQTHIEQRLNELRKGMAKRGTESKLFERYQKCIEEIIETEELLQESVEAEDMDLKQMLEEDLVRLRGNDDEYGELEQLQEEIVEVILPKNEADERNQCTLEIMQAAGGSESSLFAEDIAKMYANFCRHMGFSMKEEAYQKDMAIGKGCKYASYVVQGEGIHKYLKHESGVHKVQRVPETEKQGRIHSSTCAVVVLPQVPRDFEIDPKDITIQTKRASGAGGQHVNTTDSAVRVVHNPTGIEAQSQDERDQHQNKAVALGRLHQRVFAHFTKLEEEKHQAERKLHVSSGNLSDKIRTYNWPNNRITDHRTSEQKFGLDQMFSGQLLEEFLDELMEQEKKDKLIAILAEKDTADELLKR